MTCKMNASPPPSLEKHRHFLVDSTMASLLRKVSSHDLKILTRSKTYEGELTKLDKRLPRQSTVHSFGDTTEFDYKRDTKHLCKVMKHCITAQTLDLDYILHFLSSYTCEQRLILVHDLEFEYKYKLIDMVLERPESPMRACTLAMLVEPTELYARDFHDFLIDKQSNKINYDISKKLLEILLSLNNADTKKFRESYENLFESSLRTDIEFVVGANKNLSHLMIELIKGRRCEEHDYSFPLARVIAKSLYEAGEGTPGIDYDTFIKIFTRDTFSQLSAIFDIYEDKYGRPIQDAIEREFQEAVEIECFQDMIEYIRSPNVYYAKVLHHALKQTPIDYATLIRTIIGHEDRDLFEICLEYSKIYDETLDQTIKTHVDIMEIKRLFILLITHGHDIMASEIDQFRLENSNNTSPTSSEANSRRSSTTNINGMKRNRSQEAFDKFVNVFRAVTAMRPP